MKKTLIFTILALLILAFTLTAVSAASTPFNHRYQGYTPSSSFSDTVTFTDKWSFQEDISGKNRGFTLTKTSTRPVDIFEETVINDNISAYPYSYRDTRNFYSSYRFTNYARNYPSSFSSSRNSDRIVLEAFKTFQNDNARRDLIKNRPRRSYSLSYSYPRYSYGGYGSYYSRYSPSYYY